MFAERIWNWLGVATIAELERAVREMDNRTLYETTRFDQLESRTQTERFKLRARIEKLEQRTEGQESWINFLLNQRRGRLPKPHETNAGDKITGKSTTPTCEPTESGGLHDGS